MALISLVRISVEISIHFLLIFVEVVRSLIYKKIRFWLFRVLDFWFKVSNFGELWVYGF